MARLFADEHLPRPVVERLRDLGHDVTALGEDWHAERDMADEAVLDMATADGRVMLTFDLAYLRLNDEQRRHAGLVVCTFDPDFVGLAARVDAALSSLGRLEGKLIRITRLGAMPGRPPSTSRN